MRPYGIRFVGPVCKKGCCWKITSSTGHNRRQGHGPQNKGGVRAKAKREIEIVMTE